MSILVRRVIQKLVRRNTTAGKLKRNVEVPKDESHRNVWSQNEKNREVTDLNGSQVARRWFESQLHRNWQWHTSDNWGIESEVANKIAVVHDIGLQKTKCKR